VRETDKQWIVSARRAVVLFILTLLGAAPARAQSALSSEPIAITRSTGRITIDGDLSDDAWRTATKIDRWYEVNPGDNTEPKVKNVGYLTYDDRFFCASFEFEDPDLKTGRAPHFTELGETLGVPPEEARQIRRKAADSSVACWFVKETEYSESWAPFSNAPNNYLVTIKGEQKWYGQ